MSHILFALLIGIVTPSCSQLSDTPAPSPVFPAAESVARLVISPGASISDPGRIGEFMAALKQLNDGWAYTWHTYPTPTASIVLMGQSSNVLCHVDLGPNWLGSSCGDSKKGWPPYVHLSVEQARFFRGIAGGK